MLAVPYYLTTRRLWQMQYTQSGDERAVRNICACQCFRLRAPKPDRLAPYRKHLDQQQWKSLCKNFDCLLTLVESLCRAIRLTLRGKSQPLRCDDEQPLPDFANCATPSTR